MPISGRNQCQRMKKTLDVSGLNSYQRARHGRGAARYKHLCRSRNRLHRCLKKISVLPNQPTTNRLAMDVVFTSFPQPDYVLILLLRIVLSASRSPQQLASIASKGVNFSKPGEGLNHDCEILPRSYGMLHPPNSENYFASSLTSLTRDPDGSRKVRGSVLNQRAISPNICAA